jgi:hypothetical protein
MENIDTGYYESRARELLADTVSGWIRWSDEDYGDTVATIVGGEIGDALAESNVHAALELLAGHDEDVDTFTVGRSGRSWLRGVSVRLFRDGQLTGAAIPAVDIVDQLDDYPVLDENDYSDRRYEVHLENLKLDYGGASDVVAEALSEYSNDPEDAGHDEVCECLERLLVNHGRELTEDEADGVLWYVRQRADDLDIPTLAAQVLNRE